MSEKQNYHIGNGVARVTAVHKDRYELNSELGHLYGRLKPSAYSEGTNFYPTVGDYVRVDLISGGDSRIVETLPRTTYFSRLDPSSAGRWRCV